MTGYRISITGMHCDACVDKITTAVEQLPSVKHVQVDLEKHCAAIGFYDTRADIAAAVEAIQHAGFSVSGFSEIDND